MNIHAKLEVFISYGLKVMAKVKVLVIDRHIDRCTHTHIGQPEEPQSPDARLS